MNVGRIRKDINPTQSVEHDPIQQIPEIEGFPNNRAHSKIIGKKPVNNAEFRVGLYKIGEWAISPA